MYKCSRHITSDAIMFSELEEPNKREVTFGGKKYKKTIRVEKINKIPS